MYYLEFFRKISLISLYSFTWEHYSCFLKKLINTSTYKKYACCDVVIPILDTWGEKKGEVYSFVMCLVIVTGQQGQTHTLFPFL